MVRYIVLLRESATVVVAAADAQSTPAASSAHARDDLSDLVRRMTTSPIRATPSISHRFVGIGGRSLASVNESIQSQASASEGLPLLVLNVSAADAAKLLLHPEVLFVEIDTPIRVHGVEQQPGYALDRIDQRSLPLDGLFHFEYDGANVDIYVLDSGVRTSHSEFFGRLLEGANFATDQAGDVVTDCQGHGTHVSSLALGTRFGVAKKATLCPIRIYDCSNTGSLSQALLGIDYALRTMQARRGRRVVVSMSFGGENSPTLDAALQRLEDLGAVVVAAAGNDGRDACSVSPANGRGVIAVGSVGIADVFSEFSNSGPCVSLNAPGENVVGADFQSDDGVRVMSGTSMSTPIVAGAVASFFSFAPDATVNDARSALICGATVDAVRDAPYGTTTRLLYADPSEWADAARNHACSVSAAHESTPTIVLGLVVAFAAVLASLRTRMR
jgi:hypothetical protein